MGKTEIQKPMTSAKNLYEICVEGLSSTLMNLEYANNDQKGARC